MEQAGRSLRAPSKLHAFNRYEIKYLVRRRRGGRTSGSTWPRRMRPRRRRLRRVELYYDTPAAAVLLGEDRGPAVPPQAADAPLRRPAHAHRRHPGVRRDQAAGQPGHPEAPDRAAVPATPGGCATAGSWSATRRGQRASSTRSWAWSAGWTCARSTITGYQREAFVGRDADAGPARHARPPRPRPRPRLPPRRSRPRTGSSSRPAGRGRGQGERAGARTGSPTSPPSVDLSVVRVSKYCQSVEAFGRAPRSIFHVPDDDRSIQPCARHRWRYGRHELRYPGPDRHLQRRRYRASRCRCRSCSAR